MKKIIALVLSLVMLLTCAAALAETQKESMGTLRVEKAFDIKYSALPEDYALTIITQNNMTILASIKSKDAALPRMNLSIVFNDEWADTEKLNDVVEEDMQAIKDSFYDEYSELTFDTKETEQGTQLLVVTVPSGQEAYVYTIFKGHEIEMQILPGTEQEALTDADVERVVKFLGDLEFVPVEE
ncbi:MAG: hypothetical protein J6U01_01150 [Clostridia bacterium]|nr:hypothetical protein [Clostridia bacterium]